MTLGACPPASDSGFGGGRRPVINVSWDDAKKYVAWLSSMTGKDYRLLSEAEWEYAARAGTRTAYSFGNSYPPSKRICEYANFADISYDRQAKRQGISVTTSDVCDDGYVWTAPVGSYKPNAFGLYDMHGNVFQWTEECYADNYEGASADGSPSAIEDCKLRVCRGGSWSFHPDHLRSARRFKTPPGVRDNWLGFRVGRTLNTRAAATGWK